MSEERATGFPRVVTRKATPLSRWVTLLEKDVRLSDGSPTEVYHSITQAPYVSAFVVTRDGGIPIVRQYRPAVEAYTWEFPAGTVDEGETPAQAMVRELLEETGLHVETLHEIGAYHPDTGRLSLTSTGFFARCGARELHPSPEDGLEVRYVTLPELFDMVQSGDFRHQMHVALIASALVHGHIAPPDRRYDRSAPCIPGN